MYACRMQAPPVRAQAETAARLFVRSMSPHATPLLLPALFDAMDAKRPWQIKVSIRFMPPADPAQRCFPWLAGMRLC